MGEGMKPEALGYCLAMLSPEKIQTISDIMARDNHYSRDSLRVWFNELIAVGLVEETSVHRKAPARGGRPESIGYRLLWRKLHE